jgi:hypothetical protein
MFLTFSLSMAASSRTQRNPDATRLKRFERKANLCSATTNRAKFRNEVMIVFAALPNFVQELRKAFAKVESAA